MQIRANAVEKPDVIARYFLRRLAKAQSDSPSRTDSVKYTAALLETILIFVSLPMLGVVSLVVIPSLRWAPNTIAKWFEVSPWGDVLGIWILSLIAGHFWIGKRLKIYRKDRSAYTEFSSLRDARIVAWQRFVVFLICAIVMPFVALLLTFGRQVITRAFDLQ